MGKKERLGKKRMERKGESVKRQKGRVEVERRGAGKERHERKKMKEWMKERERKQRNTK